MERFVHIGMSFIKREREDRRGGGELWWTIIVLGRAEQHTAT